MAFTYGFYNSLRGDRKYNAEQMSEIFDGILKDGVIPSIGQLFAVSSAGNGMQINVGTGRAWFDHTWSKNDSVMVLRVPDSDITRARYDAVVLEVNHEPTVRANSIKIVRGISAVNPTKPTLVNTDRIHQYPLAYILVKAGVEDIKAADIENMVGRSPTVFATGVLETASIDQLWAQWQGEFDEWFEQIKVILSDDVVTNLQYQIDQLNNRVPYKATTSEAVAGTNDTKYITPYTAKALIDAEKGTIKDQNGKEYGVQTLNIITASTVSDEYIKHPIMNTYSQIYKHAHSPDEMVAIDVGDYIIGAATVTVGTDDASSTYCYHIIRKSDMHVKVSASVSESRKYRFIAKGNGNIVYYVQGSTLYYATVSTSGISGIHTLTSIPDSSWSMANDEYLVFYSYTAGSLKSIRISDNSVYSSAFTATSTSDNNSALIGNYLLLYSMASNGNISYTRIDVTSGASTLLTLPIFTSTVTAYSEDSFLYVFSDNVKNAAVISYRVRYRQSNAYTTKTYFILAGPNGLHFKKETPYGFTATSGFDEDKGMLVDNNVICKYTLSNATMTQIAIGDINTSRVKYILPSGDFSACFGRNNYGTFAAIAQMILSASLNKLTPIQFPSLKWDPFKSDSVYEDAKVLSTYRDSTGSGLIFKYFIELSGSSITTPFYSMYVKVPIETYPLVSIKIP